MQVPSINGYLTLVGRLEVEQRDDGHVVVRVRGDNVRHKASETEDGVELDLWRGSKVPKPGDEVHVNGTSMEVSKVETDPDGNVWLYGDGRKEKWS